MNERQAQPWYKDGLRFKCTGCGDCCTGAPGFVWVNKEEIAAGCRSRHGERRVRSHNTSARLAFAKASIEHDNCDCVFLDGKTRKCTVYNARPRQCRTWPFWDSNVRTPEAWAETCEVCPGSGTGQLYQLGEIEAQKAVIRICTQSACRHGRCLDQPPNRVQVSASTICRLCKLCRLVKVCRLADDESARRRGLRSDVATLICS